MVWIAGGTFLIGTDDVESFPNERPAHLVQVEDFWMDVNDVTNAEFHQVRCSYRVCDHRGTFDQMGGLEEGASTRYAKARPIAAVAASCPPRCFLAAHEDADFARAALDSGGLGYVVKAWLAFDLLPAIRAAPADHRFVSPTISLEENT
jgi:hypothetical protein